MAIVLDRVWKRLSMPRRITDVFEDVSIALPDDRRTGILALPGTGKSTLAYLLTASLDPDRGRIRRDGHVSFPVGSGRVFSPRLTGRENIAFLARLFGFDPRPIAAFVADFGGLGGQLDRKMTQLSRDERTRLIFVTSYAMPFDCYVVDDSLLAGRGQTRALCETLVRERMESAGFIICTSSRRVMQRYCDTAFVIEDRGIHAEADPASAIARLGPGLRNDDGAVEAVDVKGEQDEDEEERERGL